MNRSTTALIGVATLTLLTGCTGSSHKDSASSMSASATNTIVPASPNIGVSQSPESTVPSSDQITTVSKAPDDKTKNAQAFLNARDNGVSWYQKNPQSWMDQAKPYITPDFYKQLKSTQSNGGVYGWDAAHSGGIQVKVTSSGCSTFPEAPSSPTQETIACSVTDQVVGKDGKPYPLSKVPPQWPFAGKQPTAVLEMHKVGGKWLVGADNTGMAG